MNAIRCSLCLAVLCIAFRPAAAAGATAATDREPGSAPVAVLDARLEVAGPSARALRSRLDAAAAQSPGSRKPPPAKSPPLIRMLEGRERELLLGLGIALAVFILGWICGGNYYLRRDRRKRNKLRF